MSFFPRSFYDSEAASFTPLFRLLDEFDSYTRGNNGHNHGQRAHHRRGGNLGFANTFNPKFDVRETDAAYELHGELPGVERDNVSIEFTDPQTLVIRGRAERSYTAGTPPAGLVEGGAQMTGAIKEKGEEEGPASTGDKNAGEKSVSKKEEETKPPFEKYWVQERSVGEFARTFSFPSRVDQEAVSASLNNGILSLTIPKAKKHETRRIAIN